MDSSNVCNSLIAWLETFPNVSGVTVAGLADGVVMSRVLNMIDSGHFSAAWQARLKVDCGDNWRLKVSNLRKIQQSVVDYLQNLNVQYAVNTLPDLARIGEHADPEEVARMLQLILGCAINCPHKESYIGTIMSMDPEVQAVVMTTVQTVFMRDASPGAEVAPGPASFHPNQRTIAEQLEATTRARDEAVTRVLELEMQVAEAAEKREQLAAENTRLVERLEGLEGEAEGGTVSRYKDLKKKIDSLQDALFKLETSRDEYRGRVDVLEQERAEILQRCEELQKLADQAHTLQDEVDVLRDMGQRATQAETTIESYKKKLDELSDLRRQNKILENKNSEYMQHILELEEDVKKNDTWRPQLELFKKQVSELRQQLDDETKKADRLAFDCKKLTEKVEAITIEKDRVVQERDDLKEHVEELRCLNSTQSPSRRAGGPHSDLLASDQEELWERLVRLRHENEQLKKAGNSAAGSGDPVLQAMLADLQERHDSVSTENRWGRRGANSPHSPLSTPTPTHLASPPSSLIGSPSSSSMAFLDAFSCLEAPRKLRLLRKNLKWASESDLLVLRQPSLLTSFFSSFSSGQRNCGFSSFSSSGRGVSKASVTLGSSPPNGLRKVSDCRLVRPSSEGAQQIVVRHIHEFKVPSCGTEDSGCYRTSPSSCEDGPATMDSGVSGLFDSISPGISHGISGTLDRVGSGEDSSGHRISDVMLPFSSSSHSLTPFCCVAGGPFSPTHHYHHHHCSHCCRPPSRHHSCNGESAHLSDASARPTSARGTNHTHDAVVSPSNRHPSLRPTLASDSPTPHNSPRIPARVTGGRNRSSRSSLSPSHSSYSSLSEGEPSQPRSRIFLRSQSECLQSRTVSKDMNSAGSFPSNESLRNNVKRTSESRELELKKNEFNARDFQMEPIKTSTLTRNKASISADHIAFDKTQEMKVCQSFSGLEVSSGINSARFKSGKPVSVVRGVASAIQQHPAPTSKSLTNSPIQGFVRETVGVKLADEANAWQKRSQLVSDSHQGTPLPDEVSASSAEKSPKVVSLTVKNKLNSPPMPSRGTFNLETHFGMHDLSDNSEPITVVRPVNKSPNRHGNYVSFREPITVNVARAPRSSLSLTEGADAKPAAPAFRRSASLRMGRPSPALRDKSDIAQCSADTLFTHQMRRTKPGSSSKVLPLLHQNRLSARRSSAPSTSKSFVEPSQESDSDEDVLEQRLVAGAFGAPLVSSESCTSFSHDDNNDTDLAEYNTDNGSDAYDFLMSQQPLSYEDLQREHQKVLGNRPSGSPLSSKFLPPHLRNSLSRIQEEDLTIGKSPKVQAAVFSSSTSHKIRKQDKFLKLSSNTRVKKKKRNKTAKMIATETINAMFVFCAP